MPKIIQFTHPGPEHSPDQKRGNHKSWNKGKHKRKFLLSKGDFVVNNELKNGDLIFWGEWEPPSMVDEIASRPTKFHPKWLHKPYLPKEMPNIGEDNISYQNTDPCVFGENFTYFVCKQFKPKSKSRTSLAKLEAGSMVLFGSTANQNKPNAFFQLDTVFVVAKYMEYDLSDPHAFALDGKYHDFEFKMGFPKPVDYSIKLRLYEGATFQNPVHGMYSFSPAKIWNHNNREGFVRIPLKDMEYITNNLNAAPKISNVSMDQVTEFWNKIVGISRMSGCVEGIRFNYRIKNNTYNKT